MRELTRRLEEPIMVVILMKNQGKEEEFSSNKKRIERRQLEYFKAITNQVAHVSFF